MSTHRHSRRWEALAVVAGLWLGFASTSMANEYYFPEDMPAAGIPGVKATYPRLMFAAGVKGDGLKQYRLVAIPWPPADIGDPVMHLFRHTLWPSAGGASTEVARNDDCPESVYEPSLESWVKDWIQEKARHSACISYTPDQDDDYWLLVYAYNGDSGGRGDKAFVLAISDAPDNWVFFGPYMLGGYQVWYNGVGMPAADTFETVAVNDGARPTLLVRFDLTPGQELPTPVTWNTGAGTGGGAKLPGNDMAGAFLIMPGGGNPGPTRFVRNDHQRNDADGDGLGDELEKELGTCPGRAAYPGFVTPLGFSCDSAVDDRDSDGDGLPDYWELLGCVPNSDLAIYNLLSGYLVYPDQAFCPNPQSGAPAQLLPLWGADPRHKDLFVQVDRWIGRVDSAGNPDTFKQSDAQYIADRFSVLTGMNNPDGIDGVAVHVDMNEDTCTEPDDTDGITSVCGDFGGSTVQTSNCDTTQLPLLAPHRLGLFHWVQYDSSAGNTNRAHPVSAGSCAGSVNAATHELGHQLGLDHWGASSAGEVNFKPNYPSMMNYAYQSRGPFPQFSRGSWDAIDPSSLHEDKPFSGGQDISLMRGPPYSFHDFAESTPGWNLLDWNRDGVPEPGSVRAAVGEAPEVQGSPYGNTGYDHPIMQEIEIMPTSNSSLAPAAARFWTAGSGYSTYVVVNDETTHRFKYARATARLWGPPSNHTFVDIGTTPHSPDSQPALVNFNTIWGPRLVVFGATTTNEIHFATTIMPQLGFGWSSWATIPNPAPNMSFREVSAAVSGDTLYFVARDGALNIIWLGALDSSLNFLGWRAASVWPTFIQSLGYTPGLAAGPDGRLYMGVVSQGAPFRRSVNELNLFVFTGDFGTGTWAETSAAWNDGTRESVAGRPAMVWRKYRHTDGTELQNRNGALYFWYPAGAGAGGNPYVHYRWTWDMFSDTTQTFDMGKWHSPNLYREPPLCGGPTMPRNSGIALVNREDADDKNLEAFVPHVAVACTLPQGDLRHVPHADGEVAPTRAVSIGDFDDASMIRSGLCRSLMLYPPLMPNPRPPWVECGVLPQALLPGSTPRDE